MIKKLIIVLFLAGSAYGDSLFLGPSFYYTGGGYSDANTSRSFAFYNLMQVSQKFTLLQHYDNLLINNTSWKYKQQGFAGGIIADYLPYYFKFNYGHFMGKYMDNASTNQYSFDYTDNTSIYNFDFFYYFDWNYVGASYSYIDASGFSETENHQITLRFDKFVSPKVFFSIRPSGTLTEEETLFAAAIKMIYYPSESFIIKAGGFAGERSYYFDPDLIIMNNQDGIQRYAFFGQLEFILSRNIALITAYNHTAFNNFEINYFIAGIRSGFWF